MNERVKISIACFTGAAACVLTALAAAPAFWWLGMLTGFATGYLAYEFRAVVRAVPGAARETLAGVPAVVRQFGKFLNDAVLIRAPFLHAGLAIGIVVGHEDHVNSFMARIFNGFIFMLCSWYMIRFIACIGSANVERRAWISASPGVTPQSVFPDFRNWQEPVKVTYFRALRWTIEGVFVIPFAIITLIVGGGALFCWHILKKTHSNKRVLCGFNSALGGSIAWLIMGSHGVPAVLSVACGGLIGAALGLISYERVFKRLRATHNL